MPSAYSASEYDAFTVGQWRPVRSFCPRRHTWVVEYAAPIVAATVGASNPDAAMQHEPWKDAIPTRQRIVDFMVGRAMTGAEIAAGMHLRRSTINNHLIDKRAFEVVGTVEYPSRPGKIVSVAYVYRALPDPYIAPGPGNHGLQAKAQGWVRRLVAHIEAHGDITLQEAANLVGTESSSLYKILGRTERLTSYRVGGSRYVTTSED